MPYKTKITEEVIENKLYKVFRHGYNRKGNIVVHQFWVPNAAKNYHSPTRESALKRAKKELINELKYYSGQVDRYKKTVARLKKQLKKL